MKYLGIFFDCTLSWKDHVSFVLKKAGKRISMLNRISKNLTFHTADMLYKSYKLVSNGLD